MLFSLNSTTDSHKPGVIYSEITQKSHQFSILTLAYVSYRRTVSRLFQPNIP